MYQFLHLYQFMLGGNLKLLEFVKGNKIANVSFHLKPVQKIRYKDIIMVSLISELKLTSQTPF